VLGDGWQCYKTTAQMVLIGVLRDQEERESVLQIVFLSSANKSGGRGICPPNAYSVDYKFTTN